jgi:molybdate transport system ATP-binding protein
LSLSVRLAKRRGDFVIDVEFDAPIPGVTALFGRSGCGKSSIINMLAGLLSPDSGRIASSDHVYFDSTSGTSIPAEERRIGYVFQDARLFPHLSVLGNLRYGARRAPAESGGIDFASTVALLGLEDLLHRRPNRLSGGERQRVAIGRALLAKPRLLLLDEPLAALDVARRNDLLPYLETVRDRMSVPMVYVTHQFDEVLHLATRLVVLDAGKVIAQGDLAQVSLHPALRSIVGAEQIGAVFDGTAMDFDHASGLLRLSIGNGTLRLQTPRVAAGSRLRVQLLARDVIVATSPPQGLSVRNDLAGTITGIAMDGPGTDLIQINIGGPVILARVTRSATQELRLRAGQKVWALVKAASLRGHVFSQK